MNIKKLIATQNKIFWMLFLGNAALIALAVYLISERYINPILANANGEANQIVLVVVPLVCFICVVSAIVYSKQKFKTLKAIDATDIIRKFEGYNKVVIVRLILIGVGTTFCTGMFLLDGNRNFPFVVIAMILLLRLNKPTDTKMIRELDLPENELNKFSNEEENS